MLVLGQQQPGSPVAPSLPLDLWIPLIALGLLVVVIFIVVSTRRHRARLAAQAFEQLRTDLGMQPVTDPARRQQIGRYIHALLNEDRQTSRYRHAPLKHVMEHLGAGMHVSVVQVDHDGYHVGWTGGAEIATTAVVCDLFEPALPAFRLTPASTVSRLVHGQGLFPETVAFGRNNVVHSADAAGAYHVLDGSVQALLADNQFIAVHAEPQYLVVYRQDRAIDGQTLQVFIEDALALSQMIVENARSLQGRPAEQLDLWGRPRDARREPSQGEPN